jgi:hypothetical protein
MRARNLKPGFFKNEFLSECPFEARLLFAGLWCLADRAGRLEYRPKRIKAELFPFDEVNCAALVQVLCKYGLVRSYSVQGVEYLDIPTFSRHQNPHMNERQSVIPSYENRDNGSETGSSSTSTVQAQYLHQSDPAESLFTESLLLNPDPRESEDEDDTKPSELMALWNELATGVIQSIRSISSKRRAKIKTRLSEPMFRDNWQAIFRRAVASDFMRGQNSNNWTVSFDWLIENDANYVKVLEGKYNNKSQTATYSELPRI